MSDNESKTDFKYAKAIAESSALILALFFVAGWSYLQAFYRSFGIPVSDLGFQIHVSAFFVITVLREHWISALILFALAVAAAFVRRFRSMTQALIVVAAFIAAALAGAQVGREHASRDAQVNTTTLPFVVVHRKQIDTTEHCEDEDIHVLLFRNAGFVYIARPVLAIRDSDDAPRNLRVCVIPESEISDLSLQVGLSK
jgi:hypothetical protein